MKKHIRLISVLLCLFLCVSIFLSAACCIHTADHNCMGEDCHICRTVTSLSDALRNVGLCVLASALLFTASGSALIINSTLGKSKSFSSLVAHKVKITS